MISILEKTQKYSKLRQNAEKKMRGIENKINIPKSTTDTISDTMQLLHELQVYQIELELQNQELQETRAQAEVLLSHYTELYDYAITGYFTFDSKGIISQTNLKGASFVQMDRDKIIGKHFASFIVKEDCVTFNEFLNNVFMTHERQSCVVTLSNPPHLVVQIEASISNNEQNCRAIVQDITERIQKEKLARLHQLELTKVARVNSMGELASAIAHEINQPLTSIANYVNGCIRRLESNNYKLPEILDMMRLATKQVELTGAIIHHMNSLVRPDHTLYKQVSINEIAEAAVLQIKQETHYDYSIPIELQLTDNLLEVKVDHIQIELVMLNLLRNSLEAVYKNKVENPKVILRTELQNKMIIVSVINNGPHYSDEEEKHLFEPCFTTKKRGMGMGLSISRTIVEAHSGQLLAHKLSIYGVSFQFSLPIVQVEDAPNVP